jgi:UDP-arabinose 4-epimerase
LCNSRLGDLCVNLYVFLRYLKVDGMPLSNPCVLVTGGAGYIGSHTCKALAKAGYLPVSYDNLVYGHSWAVKWGPLEIGDVLDAVRLSAVIAQYQPVAAIHFAAFAYVGESVQDPQKYYHNNVVGTLNLLACLKDAGNVPLVFSSTCATYGVPVTIPISESTPQAPINPYGASKLMVERILQDFDAAYGQKAIALRYFNAAGADRDGEIGEAHDPETHLIPLAIQAAHDATAGLTVFGQDYDTPDGTAVRDYVHVEDLARAHVASVQRLVQGSGSGQINIGTGHGVSVMEIIAAVEAASGRKVTWKAGPRRPGDPPSLVADPARLKQALGLDPTTFAGLSDIAQTAWDWHVHRFAHPEKS